MGTYEKAFKEYWPKALEIAIFLVLMVTTMKSELGDNSRLIDRNHEDIISMKASQAQIASTTMRMEFQLSAIESRLTRIEQEHRSEVHISLLPDSMSRSGMAGDVANTEGSL